MAAQGPGGHIPRAEQAPWRGVAGEGAAGAPGRQGASGSGLWPCLPWGFFSRRPLIPLFDPSSGLLVLAGKVSAAGLVGLLPAGLPTLGEWMEGRQEGPLQQRLRQPFSSRARRCFSVMRCSLRSRPWRKVSFSPPLPPLACPGSLGGGRPSPTHLALLSSPVLSGDPDSRGGPAAQAGPGRHSLRSDEGFAAERLGRCAHQLPGAQEGKPAKLPAWEEGGASSSGRPYSPPAFLAVHT